MVNPIPLIDYSLKDFHQKSTTLRQPHTFHMCFLMHSFSFILMSRKQEIFMMLSVTDFKPIRLIWIAYILPIYAIVISLDLSDVLSGSLFQAFTTYDYVSLCIQYIGFLGVICYIFGIRFAVPLFWKLIFLIDVIDTLYHEYNDWMALVSNQTTLTELLENLGLSIMIHGYYVLLWIYAFESHAIWQKTILSESSLEDNDHEVS